MKQIFTRQALLLILFCIANWFAPTAQAQWFYEPQKFGQLNITPGLLGQLYNSHTFQITQVPTIYHGNQDVYATAYLPFVGTEYNIDFPLKTFGPNYTTAIALCSPKDASLGLYAPVQVAVSIADSDSDLRAFASVVPYDDNRYNYKGPFNTLPKLNQSNPAFVNPSSSEYGLTALEAAQKFTKFSHEILLDANGQGWNGYDKDGDLPISLILSPVTGHTYYNFVTGKISIRKDALGNFDATRVTIGHEIFHGIIAHTLNYANNPPNLSRKELDEGAADVIGHCFRLWCSGKLNNPDWEVDFESLSQPGYILRLLNYPKISAKSLPSTYLGEFYKTDPQLPGYDVHDNGAVLGKWFSLVVEGATGNIDDDPLLDSYSVSPLVTGSISESLKMALRILFLAFREKLSSTATYPDLRKATLDAAVDLGILPGSHAYAQLSKAWSAVGVDIPVYNELCIVKTAQSVSNGQVSFFAREGTLSEDPNSPKVSKLIDCSNDNKISTSYGNGGDYFTDWDDNQIYGDDNDELKSQYAVTLQAFTQTARDWFKNKLGYNGMDGSGHFNISNQLGNYQNLSLTYYISPASNGLILAYPFKTTSSCRDLISRNYFFGVDHFVKAGSTQSHTAEWETILGGVGEIFSLDIKQDYEQANQNPNAGDIWTLNEDMSNPALTIDFAHPKLYGRPAVYQGVNWKQGGINSGIINLWYYLLVHGTKDINGVNTPDDGYRNDEPGSKTYHVIKVDKDLVLKMVWEAYKSLPVNSSLEEFRLATHSALKLALGSNFDPKGKENIALNDAWAAVLGLPDYASTLKHFPADGETVYPWAAKVGVEVEYPKFESERLFEVSKSATFNSSEAPVYRFLNNVAPELATGMTYGLVNLEPGQIYYVRSRLSLSGNLHDGCSVTPDPDLCMSLNGKLKWTLTYEFKTEEIPAVTGLNPKTGQEIPAWSSPMSWTSMKGAAGYDIHVIDNDGTVAEQNIPFEAAYNEDEATVGTQLVLSRTKKYSWTVAAHQKLGSEWACHVLPTGMTTPFSQEEKDAMPNANGNWADAQHFQTGKPTIVPGDYPAEGQHIPLIAPQFFLSAKPVEGADQYKFQYNTPVYNGEILNMVEHSTFFKVSSVPGIADLQTINWAFTPQKKPTPPFITDLEDGETVWRKFVVDNSLSPKPNLVAFPCAEQSGLTLQWEKVDIAKGYKYAVKEAGTNLEVISDITDQLKSSIITTASKYPDPGNYVWGVSAGVKDPNGNWLFGPEATATYGVRPNAPVSITPANNTIATLGDNNSVTFSWQSAPDPHLIDKHIFFLSKETGNGFEPVPGFDMVEISGNQITVTNLEFDKKYRWLVNNFSDVSVCGAATQLSEFKTKPQPIIPEIGFTVSVDDYIIKKGIKVFLQGSCIYSVKVRRPDGQVMDFGEYFSNTSGITFTPGIASGLQGVGQIPEMAGDWEIELEITATNFEDYAATPTINLSVLEYFKDPASNNFTFNKIYPANGGGAFGGRVIHHKVVFGFNYQFPTN